MNSLPPRFVPTLTEVVHPVAAPLPAVESVAAAGIDGALTEDELVARVLQRVDLFLERRFREALGQLILEHAERLRPQLREEIEVVVRQSVREVSAQGNDNDRHTTGV